MPMLGGLYTNEQNKQTNKQNKQTYGRTDERADRQTDEHTTTPTITQKEKKRDPRMGPIKKRATALAVRQMVSHGAAKKEI